MNLPRTNRSNTSAHSFRPDSPAATKTKFRSPTRHILAGAAALGLLVSTAHAASSGWNLTSGTNDYNTAGNWVGGNINGLFDSSLTLTGAETVTFATDTVLTTGLNFNYAGNYALTLDSSNSTPHTLTLGGDISVGMASNQTVTIGNTTNALNINLGGTTRTFTVNSGKNLVFVNSISGTNGITIAGAGTTTFSGSNSYSGATTLNGGTLKLSGSMGSAKSSDITANAGTTLTFDSGTSGVTGTARAKSVTLNSGTLAVTGNSTINSADSITNALAIGSGASTVTISGGSAKNWQLDAASLVRNAGGAVLFRGTNLGVNAIGTGTNSANVVFSSAPALSGTGPAGTSTVGIIAGAYGDTASNGTGFGATGGLVTYDSTHGVRLLNTATEYTSAIASGQTQLDNARYVNTSGSGVITTTLGSGTTSINSLSFNVTGTGTNSGVTINGSGVLKINSGVVYAYQGVTTAATSDAMLITGTSGGSGGLSLDFNGKEASFIVATNGISNAVTNAPLEVDSAITNAQGLTKNGSGLLKLSGTAANTYSGTTTVNAGYLTLAKSVSNVAVPGDLVLNGGAVMDGGNQFADTSNVTINGGTLYFAGSSNTGSATSETFNNLTINGGQTSNASGHSNSLTLNGNTTLTGGSLNGSSGETFNFGGVLTLSGGTFNVGRAYSATGAFDSNANVNGGLVINNTASGIYIPININSGTGGTNNGGRLMLASDVTFNGNSTNANTATIGSGTSVIPGTIALVGTRTFNIGDGAATNDLTIAAGITNTTLSATPGSLVKTGAGTLAFTGSNSYSGVTSINAGTLALWNSSALAGGGNVTFGGGTLQYSGSNTADYSGVILNSGSAITIDTNAQNIVYNSALAASNTGGLDKVGAGTLTLAGANTYTGTTTVDAGTLKLSGAGTLGDAGNSLSMNGGTLDLAGVNANVGNLGGTSGTVLNNTTGTTATLNIGNNNATGGNYLAQLIDHTTGTGVLALTKVGSGTASISSSNSYSGATTVNGGMLKFSGTAGSAGNSDVTVNNGATVVLDSSANGTTGTTRAKSVTLNSGSLSATGNATVNSTDSITNALAIGAGASTVTVSGGSATNWQLNAGSFNRNDGGVVLFRGTNLGGNAIGTGTNGGNITFDSTSSLLSGTGTAGTSTVGIIAGAYGDTTSAGTGFGSTGGLVTYDSTYGVRLLDTATEYSSAITDGQTRPDNVRYVNTSGAGVVTTTLTSGTTSISSLSFNITGGGTNSGVTVTGNAGTTLKLNSGVIYAYQNVSAPDASDIQIISVPTLDLNGKEGIVIAANTSQSNSHGALNAPLEIDSAITNDGGNGLTKAGSGELKIGGTAQSTYTGNTVMDAGELYLAKTGTNVALPNGNTLVINSGLVLQSNNQIPDSSNVDVNGGTWQISTSTSNGNHSAETINNLVMTGGSTRNGASNGGTLNILGSAIISGGTFSGVGLGSNITVSGSLAVSNGGTVVLGRSSTSGTSYDSTLTLNGGVAITNIASGAYTPISITSGTGGTNNGGRVILASNLTFTGNSTNSNTTIISGTSGAGLAGVIMLTGTRTFTIGDGAAAIDLTISAPLIDGTTAGALIKNGAGTLSLTGSNTYSGGTTISSGMLIVMNTLNGTMTISGGAILGGSGTETGLVTASGATSVFAPGDVNSIGTLDLTGGASAANGATFNYNINGDAIDTIDFRNGALTLGGTVAVNFTSLGAVNIGQPYSLFAGNGTWSGSPTFVFNPPAGLHLDTGYGSGNGYVWDPANNSFTVQFANNVWYLVTNQTGAQDWGNGFLSYWNSQPDGSGTAPTAINIADDYVNNTSARQVRTPVISSTFGGNSLTLGSGATLTVTTYAGEESTIPYLVTAKGTISGSPASNYTQNVNITDFLNQSGTTTITTGTGNGLALNVTSLTGPGAIAMSSGGNYYLNISEAYNYLGAVNLSGGVLAFQNPVSSGGGLIISGTGAQVTLTQPVVFRSLSISGSNYASGTYSYSTLHSAYPSIFTSGSSGGSITVQPPLTWYLAADQAPGEDWTQASVSDWNSNSAGTGTVAASVNLVDNYINNAGTNDLRTPSMNSTFGGGTLTLGGSAILDLQTVNGAVSTIPNFISNGGTVAGLSSGYVQSLTTGSYTCSSGTTIYSASAGSGINLSAATISGSGNINLTGGGSFVLNFADPSGYAGTITLASGSLDIETPASGIPFFTLGGFVVNSGAAVTLNNRAYFSGLTVNGSVKSTGTYSASSLGFSGTGTVVVYTRDVAGPPQMFGVNLSGAEGGTIPGTYGFNYTYPTDAEMAYYQGKGLTLIRLPFRWERIQHTLNSSLDSSELSRMDAVVGYARNRGMKVILDMHNYFSCIVSGTSYKIGTTQVPYSAYQDVWSRIASHYATETAVYGYDIMNEPVTSLDTWSIAAQDVVDTIRMADTTHYIFCEGVSYSGAQSWLSVNSTLNILDPVGRLIYSAHSYWDSNHDGVYGSYSSEGGYPNMAVDYVAPFLTWLQSKPGAHGHIGEYGVPYDTDSSSWNVVLDNFMSDIKNSGLSGTYWAGGPWLGTYQLNCEPVPITSGTDKPQMSVLENYHQ